MKDVIVSIRMREQLLQQLKQLIQQGQFLDISEAVRSIVRQKWLSAQHPDLLRTEQLRTSIKEELKEKFKQWLNTE